uniref:CAZy families GT2 protein n=1 Tax=uncultured Afipia sp. TaxID=218203 RepID=A0A060BZY7_9BRAD|nr:CAZy families GT2 protein [uncultured Afipia sp.]
MHWMLLSVAAWRALFQLIFKPYHWEKTEHGTARTSRLARRQRAERIVATILEGAAGAQIAQPRNISAGRRPRRRASVSY